MKRLPASGVLRGLSALALFAATSFAQSITGQIVDINNTGISGVRIDPGNGITPVNTNASGNFTVNVPAGSYTVSVLPRTLPYAPQQFLNVVVSGTAATSIGTVVLQPGFVIFGTAFGPGGVPAAGGKVSVFDEVTGVKQFTPSNTIAAAGTFSATMPAGTWKVRITPPTSATWLPQEVHNVVVTNAAVNLGTFQLVQGYLLTGTVVDAATQLPLAGVKLSLFDGLTNQSILLLNATTDVNGNYTAVVPFGLINMQYEPAAGDTHEGCELFDMVVLGSETWPNVGLNDGVLTSGVVVGPNGPVAGANIDIFDVDGSKLYLAHDHTDSTGAFNIATVTGLHQIVVKPPDGSGLVGTQTGYMLINGPTSLGTLTLAAGNSFSGVITGPNGSETLAHLRVFDPVTGLQLITTNAFTDATGAFSFPLPNGTWNVQVVPDEQSHGAATMFNAVSVQGPTVWNQTLAASPLFVQVGSYGTPSLRQGWHLPISAAIANLAGVTLHTSVEITIRFPSGAEQPILPPMYLDLPAGFSMSVTASEFPLPPLPSSALGKELQFTVRFRDPSTGLVQDEDSTPFYVF